MTDRPVFIVGASRSGTALLRSSLNRHPGLHVAGETHFFDDLRTRVPREQRLQGRPRDEVVALFRGLSHRPYGFGGDPDEGWLEAEDLIERANARGGRADDYFAAFCELEGLHECGVLPRRWGEKTPRHVYRIDELVEAFPEAQVVVMVRDPRAVVASYRDWRDKTGFDVTSDEGLDEALTRESMRTRLSYHPVLATVLWRASVLGAAAARRAHGPATVRVVRYEDLVSNPRVVLRELSSWLGEDFHEAMVAVPVHNSSHMTFDRHGGFRPDAIDRWRDKLTDDEVAAVQTVAGRVLRGCRYERVPVAAQGLRAIPWLLGTPATVVSAARANRGRMGAPVEYVLRRLRSLA